VASNYTKIIQEQRRSLPGADIICKRPELGPPKIIKFNIILIST
jgi:hypothetical protein